MCLGLLFGIVDDLINVGDFFLLMMTRFFSFFSVFAVFLMLASGLVHAQEATSGTPSDAAASEVRRGPAEPNAQESTGQLPEQQPEQQVTQQAESQDVRVFDVKAVQEPGGEASLQVVQHQVVQKNGQKDEQTIGSASTPAPQNFSTSVSPVEVAETTANSSIQQTSQEQQAQQSQSQQVQPQQKKTVVQPETQSVAAQPAVQGASPLNQAGQQQPTQQTAVQTAAPPEAMQAQQAQAPQVQAGQLQPNAHQSVYANTYQQPNGSTGQPPGQPYGQNWYTGQVPPVGFYLMQPDDIAQTPSVQKAIQASVKALQPEPAPEQKTPPLPTCHVETDVSVWVFGGTKQQGQLLCFNAGTKELEYAPVFMTKVFAHSGGFDPNAGLYDQVFLYDMTQINKNGKRVKPKRRLFDYEEMEFQRINFLPWCNQAIDITPGKEYVVFVKTPATNYWFDLASRTINTGTTLGSLLAGYFIAR